MNTSINTAFRFSTALLIGLSLISGCSSSSDSPADVSTASSDVSNSTTGNSATDSGNTISGNPINTSSDDATASETLTNTTSNGSDGTIIDNSSQSATESSTVETTAPTAISTRVNFDIDVPFYLSNELQVRLVSGDIDTTAMWVTGVSWAIVEDFPANSENPLTFTFYDENGRIELASVDTNFTTGTSASENFQVTADQWDIDRWDNDNDGIGNLVELWQGSDPRSRNNAVEPLAANFVQAFSFLPSIESGYARLESDIPVLGQPININEAGFEDRLPTGSTTTTREITLSADGNGTYSDTWYNFIQADFDALRNLTGTRSSQGNIVSWSGVRETELASSTGYRVDEDVFEVSSTLDGRELRQIATSTVTYPWFINSLRLVQSYDIVLDLDSKDTEGKCAVLHGSLSQAREITPGESDIWEQEQVYTANRSSADVHWEWTITVDGNSTSAESSALENRFYCDFQFQESNSNRLDDTFSLLPDIEWASSLYENELLTHRLPARIQSEMSVQSSEIQNLSSTRDINISAEGNGTLSGGYIALHGWIRHVGGNLETNSSGTRSSQENTVSWSGTEVVTGRTRSGGYDENAFETSSTINGSELTQTGSGSIKYRIDDAPARRYQYDIVLDLRSINSENTCSVLRGQLSISTENINENSSNFGQIDQTTVSRSSSDESWAWMSTIDGETQSGLATALGNRFHCEYLFNQRL